MNFCIIELLIQLVLESFIMAQKLFKGTTQQVGWLLTEHKPGMSVNQLGI